MQQHTNTIGYYRERCAPPLTQPALARALGKHVNTIQLWERAGVAKPADLLALAALFIQRGAINDYDAAATFWKLSGRTLSLPPPELLRLFGPAPAPSLLVPGSPPAPALPAGSRMPFRRSPLLVGRACELQWLAQLFEAASLVAITGMGGLGKTQLAIEFVHRYGPSFAGGAFWLSFADPAGVPAELAACGGAGHLDLRPNFGHLPLDQQAELVQAAWATGTPRLLVFDNCEDEALLARWLPVTGGCRVLLTSRRAQWDAGLGLQALPLAPLEQAASVQLLRQHGVADGSTAELGAIATAVGNLPLALHLAGSFLAHYARLVPPACYLAQLQELQGDRLGALIQHRSLHDSGAPGRRHDLEHSFALSYDRLDPRDPTDALAQALLARATYFAPGEPLARDLLVSTLGLALGDLDGALHAEDALARLAELGLIETAGTCGSLRLHRLLAAFVRARAGADPAQALVEQALLAAAERLSVARLPAKMLALQTHLRAAADAASPRADARAAELCAALGWQLVLLSAFEQAEHYLLRSLAIREALFGPEHATVAECLNLVGLWHQFRGEFLLARPCYERALAIWQLGLGPDHEQTGTAHNNLGYLLFHLQEFEQAQLHLRRALTICRRHAGLRNEKLARILNNLGYMLSHSGAPLPARRYLRLALAIREQLLGASPATAQTLNNLGEVLFALGDYPGAQRCHERALAMRDAVFGQANLHSAESLRNLGLVLAAQGDRPAARDYLERALALSQATAGEQHIETAWKQAALGTLLYEQGDACAARPHLERALATYCRVLPACHRDVVRLQRLVDSLQQSALQAGA